MNKNSPMLVLLAVILVSLMILQPTNVKASPKTITVPSDYPTIQSAIDNATAGDTILVMRGSYDEVALEITKPLTIISQVSHQAKINLNPTTFNVTYPNYGTKEPSFTTGYMYNNAININSSDVTFSGFVITTIGGAVLAAGNNIQIINNDFGNVTWWKSEGSTNKTAGMLLYVYGSNENITSNNAYQMTLNCQYSSIVSNSADTCRLIGSYNTLVNNCFVGEAGGSGIWLQNADHNTLHRNTIEDKSSVIGQNSVAENAGKVISGLDIFHENYSIITMLNFYASGIILRNATQNLIYENNILGGVQAFGEQLSLVNFFDNGSIGNFWSDYQLRYPNSSEVGNSGVWNQTYLIYGDIKDNYPLVNKPNTSETIPILLPAYTLSVPELSWLIILPLLSAILVAAILLHRKTANQT
jgi:hypothetical protein